MELTSAASQQLRGDSSILRVRDLFGEVHDQIAHLDVPGTRTDELIEALASAAAVVVDSAGLYDESQSRLGWIEAISDVRAELLSGADIDGVVETAARRARDLTSGDVVFVLRPRDPEQPSESVRELAVTVAEGECVLHSVQGAVPVAGTTVGVAFSEQVSVVCATLDDQLGALTVGSVGSVVVVPFSGGATVSGVLVIARRAGQRPFDDDTLKLVTDFTDQTASDLAMATANRRSHRLEVLADRDRIARDLHDHVIQRVFAAGMNLQGTLQRSQSPDVRRRLTGTIDDLQDVVQEIRTTIFDLQDEGPQSAQLRQRIHEVIDHQAGDTDVRTYLRLSGPLSVVAPDMGEHVLAVVREAVSNGVRHAAAETITVTIAVANDLTVEVVDDGIGMPATVSPSGLGNLRSRARELGGDLTLGGPPTGTGLVLSWCVPL